MEEVFPPDIYQIFSICGYCWCLGCGGWVGLEGGSVIAPPHPRPALFPAALLFRVSNSADRKEVMLTFVLTDDQQFARTQLKCWLVLRADAKC